MHLLDPPASGIVESENGSLRPAMTFGQQRHRQKNRRGGGGEPDANFASPLTPKHHSKAARTLLRAAKWGARSVPVDRLGHSVPVCSSHRR